jgi:F-type H+-transporting ATPase subunit epsilon
MARSDKTFRCRIETPDGTILDKDVAGAKVPALDGYVGVLPGRAPLTAVVYTGMIGLTLPDGQAEELFVSRGFLRVSDDVMTILAEECKPLDQLDAEQAWDQLQEAYQLPRQSDAQFATREEAVHAARIRFSLAQRARKGMMSMDELMSRGLGD